jgi:hypothetical protein
MQPTGSGPLCSSGLRLRCAGFKLLLRPAACAVVPAEPAALSDARRELIGLGLIAYQKPLYQLLSLEDEVRDLKSQPPQRSAADSEPQAIGAIAGQSLKAMVETFLQKGGAKE